VLKSRLVKDGRRRRAGFTLVETLIVLFVMVLIAAGVTARLVTFTQARAIKDLEANVARLPTEARNEAVTTQTPVRIRIVGADLVEEQVSVSGEPVTIKEVDLSSTLTVDGVQLNGQTSDTGSWAWTVYPDGSADKAGIQFPRMAR